MPKKSFSEAAEPAYFLGFVGIVRKTFSIGKGTVADGGVNPTTAPPDKSEWEECT
jgi:hypothetical protein